MTPKPPAPNDQSDIERHTDWSRDTVHVTPPPGQTLKPAAKSLKYSEDQPRDNDGKWTDSGGGGGSATADKPNAGARAAEREAERDAVRASSSQNVYLARQELHSWTETVERAAVNTPLTPSDRASLHVVIARLDHLAEGGTAHIDADATGPADKPREREAERASASTHVYLAIQELHWWTGTVERGAAKTPLTQPDRHHLRAVSTRLRHLAPPNEGKSLKYSDSQPRDNDGKWTSGGGGGGAAVADKPNEPIVEMPADAQRARASRLTGDRQRRLDTLPPISADPHGDTVREQGGPFIGIGPDREEALPFRAVAPPLADFEAHNVDQPYETIAVYDDDGSTRGFAYTEHYRSQVGTEDRSVNSWVKGAALLTHNHPSGGALSSGDLANAYQNEIGAIRAVGRLDDGSAVAYEYRPGRWEDVFKKVDRRNYANPPDPTDIRHTPEGAGQLAAFVYESHMAKLDSFYQAQYSTRARTQGKDRAQKSTMQDHTNAAMQAVAKDLGGTYTRKLLPGGTPRSGRARTPGSRSAPRHREGT